MLSFTVYFFKLPCTLGQRDSELVGLIPLKGLLDEGKYFLKKQMRSTGVSDKELVKIAVKSLGLDDLYPFKPEEKIIEYVLEEKSKKKLADMTIREFMEETASESPAPGGGSVSACMGSLGVDLGTMVVNLSSHKRGWDERWEEFSDWADKGKAYQEELLRLIDEDTDAFHKIMDAFSLPNKTEEEANYREKAIQDDTKNAILVPFKVMETALKAMEVVKAMAEMGNPNSISDAGVGALALRSCLMGASLNVKINTTDFEDKEFVKDILSRTEAMETLMIAKETELLRIVIGKIS